MNKYCTTKRLLLSALCLFTFLSLSAQPGWTREAAKAVFTLKTFAPDGTLLGSSNGFFISETGYAVSTYTPFVGASRAVVIDAQGKELQVEAMLGANELYDVAKFRVAGRKLPALRLSATNASVGQTAWVLPYSLKKPAPIGGSVSKAETFQDSYAYYTIGAALPENAVGCPLLNEQGEVIGIMQPSAQQGDVQSYALSAAFAADMKISGLSLNDAALRKTSIKMALPDQKDDALLMMFMASSTLDSLAYATVVEDFIHQFPNAEEGYVNRAQLKANGLDFAAAARDMQQAISVSETKDNAHFAYARMIYQKEVFQSQVAYPDWTLDLAASEAEAAYAQNPLPTYRQLLAQIWFAQQKYDEALGVYKQLATSDLRGAELFYETARCYEQKGDTLEMLALLDSAVACYSKPYLKEAAPYLWARGTARMNAGKYRLAVQDMNEYEKLMSASGLTADFYYIREQAEMGGRQFQQALDDIHRATQLAPGEAVYFAEQASVESRVGMYDDAILSARECIRLAPDYSDGYLLLGVALCQKGQKAEGLPQLQKARELGNAQADALIQKFQ